MTEGTRGLNNRIVVGMDLTETGDRALEEALSLAKHLPNAEVHVGYAVAMSHDFSLAKELEYVADELRAKLSELRVRVAEVCSFPWVGPPRSVPIVFHVRVGEAADALHQLAVDVDATMIVVGTHARTGVQKLLLGSVADKLARTARVSVLVAHPKNFVGLTRSDHVEPAPVGEVQTARHGVSQRLHLEYRDRGVHISGLI